ANSLNFLNKPTSPAKTIGPQPKPSTAAPKSAFLDRSNPWAVGKGAPAQPAYNPLPQNKPAPKTQTPARAAIPSRGYNYTDGSYTGATPQARAREVDQAQMAAQATRQRREREAQAAAAQAQAAPKPVKVQAREFAQPVDPAYPFPRPPDFSDPAQAAAFAPQTAAPRPKSLEQRAAEAWIKFVSGYNPLPGNQPAQPQAPAAQPQQRTAGTSTAYQLDAPPTVATPPPSTSPSASSGQRSGTATPPAPTPAAPGTNVPTATGQPLFYGYAAPGPLTVERTAPLQGGQMRPWMTDRPQYTPMGVRAMLSDSSLAAEDTYRQRDAAGGSQTNLSAPGVYRPWSALTDAEKYQRRFGVMPQGAQMVPDNSTGVAAQAASTAQRERLIKEYWQKYAPILGWVDPPLWQYEGAPRMGTEPIQRGPALRQAQGPAGAAAPAKAATQATVLQEAQALAKLYLNGLDTTDFELQDIVAILSRFNPPPDLQQQFSDDMTRLAARIPND
ncbi:MAG: hypothetical protein KAX65_02470, partial [Caldilineaceae bacterium]|nr:hypothetical protein [Caldilineaceae bacterium]